MKYYKKLASAAILCFSASAISAPPTLSFEQRDITNVGWSVEYMGCEYNSDNDTATYHYDMSVDGSEKDLSHWVLGIASDIVVTGSTGGNTTSTGLDPTTGLYGFKWDDGQDKGTTSSYSISFNGNCSEGTIEYSVKGGTYFAIGNTTGPSDDGNPQSTTYSISGLVYLDANGNGQYDVDEPTISNASVILFDASGNQQAVMYSDGLGYYSFSGLVNGDYDVTIPNETADESDFNETLSEYFHANNSVISTTINEQDVTDVNFGYQVSLTDIVDDINTDDPDNDGYSFTGSGKTIGFWKHQHSVAIKGRGRAHVDSITLTAYLNAIEEAWLADPFVFTSDLFGSSFDILSARTSDANELLLKQLLACELNYMDSRGISDNLALQGLLLAWSEYISYYNYLYSREEILAVKDMLDMINNSGE